MAPHRDAVQLIAYADRLGGDLHALRRLLDGPLRGLGGVHLLPFFTPFDGCDAGFDPVDHAAVDPRLGTWDDVRALGAGRRVWADLVVNHVSAGSAPFTDWLERGDRSPYDGMFLTFDRVFPKGATEADLAAVYRPRPGLPLTPYRAADGTRHLVWTTFDPAQVDLDVGHPATWAYLTAILDRLASAGVSTVRLDAAAYAVKSPGTSMFLTEECLAFIESMRDAAHVRGMDVLVELHGHHHDQLRLAERCDLVYDFGLPPLLLHALLAADVGPLARWFDVRPRNAVTVLDTHDGIGIVDVAADGDRPGILGDDALHALVARVAAHTDGLSTGATRAVPWQALPYSLCTTYLDALGGDHDRMLAARLVQLFTPGVPQLYYVGLLGGRNAPELFARTGQGREVNRRRYQPDEVEAACATPAVAATLALARWRSAHPAFDGAHRWSATATTLELAWRSGEDEATLSLDVTDGSFEVAWTGGGRRRVATSAAEVASMADGL